MMRALLSYRQIASESQNTGWWIKDLNGDEHGPFPAGMMRRWTVGTEENNWSDRLSRGDVQSVLAEAEALGWSTSLSNVDDAGWRPLREAARVNALPQGDAPQP